MRMNPWHPPADIDMPATMARVEALRCFDRNGGKSFDLPKTDPHGNPISLLSREELIERRDWAMLPEFHKAIRAEEERRDRINFYAPLNP